MPYSEKTAWKMLPHIKKQHFYDIYMNLKITLNMNTWTLGRLHCSGVVTAGDHRVAHSSKDPKHPNTITNDNMSADENVKLTERHWIHPACHALENGAAAACMMMLNVTDLSSSAARSSSKARNSILNPKREGQCETFCASQALRPGQRGTGFRGGWGF